MEFPLDLSNVEFPQVLFFVTLKKEKSCQSCIEAIAKVSLQRNKVVIKVNLWCLVIHKCIFLLINKRLNNKNNRISIKWQYLVLFMLHTLSVCTLLCYHPIVQSMFMSLQYRFPFSVLQRSGNNNILNRCWFYFCSPWFVPLLWKASRA